MTAPVRLTQLAKRAGCAAKQPPGYLLPLLSALPPITDPNVLVGSATADDAAVYKINDDLAIVLTTDFFTPIVDNPREFGAIAAANALSDVYAMGGKPIAALSIVGFPDQLLPVEVLIEILQGATAKAAEAGIAIVGGHTIKSEEPIFGLAVTGTISPRRVLANDGARPGDVLLLTKPLGTGIITTAAKNNEDRLGAIQQAIEVMSTLNRVAAEVLTEVETHALTDVTGFGLLGHLRNMVVASKVCAHVFGNTSAPASPPAARTPTTVTWPTSSPTPTTSTKKRNSSFATPKPLADSWLRSRRPPPNTRSGSCTSVAQRHRQSSGASKRRRRGGWLFLSRLHSAAGWETAKCTN